VRLFRHYMPRNDKKEWRERLEPVLSRSSERSEESAKDEGELWGNAEVECAGVGVNGDARA